MTAFGQATMYVYLLHTFILYPVRESGILRDDHSSASWLLTMVFASIAITIFLSAPFIRRVFRPLIEPNPRWLFLHDDKGDFRGSRNDPTGARRPTVPPRPGAGPTLASERPGDEAK
jgi:peptidoglycan/LPS O-acetylase OafA/YrhL